ncbi:MAG: hypothetical protein F6K28_41420 [Microcoleus sp. SIO2G3]|nr:hypothetical protein [Microcoleus sp. SIO2G3]
MQGRVYADRSGANVHKRILRRSLNFSRAIAFHSIKLRSRGCQLQVAIDQLIVSIR